MQDKQGQWQYSARSGIRPSLRLTLGLLVLAGWLTNIGSVSALPNNETPPSPADQLELDPSLLENSPVLQRWLETVPDIQTDIERDPSFATRLRVGYMRAKGDSDSGILIGVEDIFVGRSGLTISGDYRHQFDAPNHQYGADLRYHLLPLGQRVNIAPVVGYRVVAWEDSGEYHETDGANIGVRLILVPSRTGAADISLSQTWVNPGGDRQTVSQFTLSAGYAVTPHLRLSSDIQIQNVDSEQNTTMGLVMEWLL